MTWWSNKTTELKKQNRFLLVIGDGFARTVKSCTKPTATIGSKDFQLINNFYSYPGLVTWEDIEVKFVDGAGLMQAAQSDPMITLDTSKILWDMLLKTSYKTPDLNSYTGVGDTTPSKKSTINDSLRGSSGGIEIRSIDPEGKLIESWFLVNPIITKISWGNLDYYSDEAVEYSMTIKYDWANCVFGRDQTGVDGIADATPTTTDPAG